MNRQTQLCRPGRSRWLRGCILPRTSPQLGSVLCHQGDVPDNSRTLVATSLFADPHSPLQCGEFRHASRCWSCGVPAHIAGHSRRPPVFVHGAALRTRSSRPRRGQAARPPGHRTAGGTPCTFFTLAFTLTLLQRVCKLSAGGFQGACRRTHVSAVLACGACVRHPHATPVHAPSGDPAGRGCLPRQLPPRAYH